MKTHLLWNKLALLAFIFVMSACEKNESPGIEEEDGYYVTMTINGERIEYKSGVTALLSGAPDESIDYQQFSLTVAGKGGIKGSEALFLNCFVYDTWKTNKSYKNTFEPDENGDAGNQDQISMQYLSEALADHYLYTTNDSFQTGSAEVVLTEVTSTYIKGTFRGVMDQAVLPQMTPQGNVVTLVAPLEIEGKFYAAVK
ncbi:hypothetical protein [Parapedobacter pyrenivorans]|uniref:hypothetical protein n=1 Tax=Parapedobacter pyrenivorans TaxID=1305674 RepID=UPI00333E1FF6